MKRSRAELAANSGLLAGTPPPPPAKSQRRGTKEQVRKVDAAMAEKTREGVVRGEDGGRRMGTAPATTEYCSSPPVGEEAADAAWEVGDGELGGGLGGWWWLWPPGVEEEKLLGWFPFAAEHFACLEEKGGGDEVEEEDHDIWQLQHIHEIPNPSHP